MKFDSRVVAYAGWEMLLMRAAFAWLVWDVIPPFQPFLTQPHPNGLALFFDLTPLSQVAFMQPLRILLAVALVFYVGGCFSFAALTIMTVLLVAVGSLNNSQGAINHTYQPIALVALAQWAVSGWLLVTRIRAKAFRLLDSRDIQRLLIHWAKVAFVACYVVSGVTKLINSNGGWILRTPNLAVAISKSNIKSHLNHLDEPGRFASAAPEFIIQHPVIVMVIAGSGLVLELFAFLALMGRWPAVFIGTGLVVMHFMIAEVMRLRFDTYQDLAVIFLINIPYLVVFAICAVVRRIRKPKEA